VLWVKWLEPIWQIGKRPSCSLLLPSEPGLIPLLASLNTNLMGY